MTFEAQRSIENLRTARFEQSEPLLRPPWRGSVRDTGSGSSALRSCVETYASVLQKQKAVNVSGDWNGGQSCETPRNQSAGLALDWRTGDVATNGRKAGLGTR